MVKLEEIVVLQMIPIDAWSDEEFRPAIYRSLLSALTDYAEQRCMMISPEAWKYSTFTFKRFEHFQFVDCVLEVAEFVQVIMKAKATST